MILNDKVALYFQSLARPGGGAEKQLIWLATALQRRGFNIAVITLDDGNATSFYPIPAGVKWHKLGYRPGLFNKVRRCLRLTKLLRDHAIKIVIGFVVANNKAFILSGLISNVKMIAAERNSPQIYNITQNNLGRLMTYLSMRSFDKITVQFEDFVDAYPPFLRCRIVPITNPIFQVSGQSDPGDKAKCLFRMLFVGRFNRLQKQPSMLLEAFRLIAPQYPDWELVMVGDGEEKTNLLNQVTEFGLQDKVKFLPSRLKIGDVYQQADLFVIPSLWEGSPNALAEAMAYGLPAVGFRVDGVRQLIKDHRTGWLCSIMNVESLAKTLQVAIESRDHFKKFGQMARDVTKTYSEDAICQRWVDLILSLEE